MLTGLPIVDDAAQSWSVQSSALALARTYGLTGYDAVCLELVLRTGRRLATFDRQLADAVRKAGGLIFGDPA
jgi:predicted nucleic acid-binding protein